MRVVDQVVQVLQNASDGLTARQVFQQLDPNRVDMQNVYVALNQLKSDGRAVVLDGTHPSAYVLSPEFAAGKPLKAIKRPRPQPRPAQSIAASLDTPAAPADSKASPASPSLADGILTQATDSPIPSQIAASSSALVGMKLRAIGDCLLAWPEHEPPKALLRIALDSISEAST